MRAKPIVLTGVAAMAGAAFILNDPIFSGLALSQVRKWPIADIESRRVSGRFTFFTATAATRTRCLSLTFLVVPLAAAGAHFIHLDDSVGAFLAGVAVNRILTGTTVKDKIVLMGEGSCRIVQGLPLRNGSMITRRRTRTSPRARRIPGRSLVMRRDRDPLPRRACCCRCSRSVRLSASVRRRPARLSAWSISLRPNGSRCPIVGPAVSQAAAAHQRKVSGRKPSGQKGHQGSTRTLIEEPDHVVVMGLEGTCTCGRCPSQIDAELLPERRHVVELMKPRVGFASRDELEGVPVEDEDGGAEARQSAHRLAVALPAEQERQHREAHRRHEEYQVTAAQGKVVHQSG